MGHLSLGEGLRSRQNPPCSRHFKRSRHWFEKRRITPSIRGQGSRAKEVGRGETPHKTRSLYPKSDQERSRRGLGGEAAGFVGHGDGGADLGVEETEKEMLLALALNVHPDAPCAMLWLSTLTWMVAGSAGRDKKNSLRRPKVTAPS